MNSPGAGAKSQKWSGQNNRCNSWEPWCKSRTVENQAQSANDATICSGLEWFGL